MIRYLIATLALIGGLGYTVVECQSGDTRDAVGVALTADEMAFTVGQSGCPVNTALKSQTPQPCIQPASVPNFCKQKFTNANPPADDCCVTAGGTKGCPGEPSYTTDSPNTAKVVLNSGIKCANEPVFTCTCGVIIKFCFETAGNAGPCGTKSTSSPSC